MTWTKLSDDWSDDCWTLSSDAYRLHCDALVWSNRKLLDCLIPKSDMDRFKTPGAVGELLEGGWWADEGEHYRIVHHSDYQPTREKVIARQGLARENGRLGGRPRKPKTEQVTEKVTEQVTQPEPKSVSPDGDEGAENPAGNPVANRLANPAETQGDGTGQDALRGEHMETENDDEKETVPLDHDGTCADCGAELPLTADALLSHRCVREYSGGPVNWDSGLRAMTR